ncbi:MAG: hypothetical protein JNK72_13790 [Myxococcales bacterium]|nr:hypothetical protein [Myxococcales bacterium]
MLFTRFWILLLAAIAGLSGAAMTLARKTYDHDRETDTGALVAADRRSIDEFLRRDARTRLDDLTPVAANPQLVTLMEQTVRRTDDSSSAIGTQITGRLRELNRELGPLRGDMLIAVDPRGMVVGRTGLNEGEVGQYLGGHPLVERALGGNVRDDLWEVSGVAYRMSARPVISQGRYYVGAILHGMALNASFAETIARLVPGASVVFFGPEGQYAGFTPVPERGGSAAPAVAVLSDQIRTMAGREDWRLRGVTDPILLPDHGGIVVYGQLPGGVGAAGGGVAVGRALPSMPADFLLKASKEDMARVPWATLVGLVVALALVGFAIVFVEYDSKKKRLLLALKELGKAGNDRIDPLTLSGFARDVAVGTNDALDAVVGREVERAGGRRRSVGDLESLLSAPESAGAPASAPKPPPPPGGSRPMTEAEEQAHWRDIFTQFSARRRETGETGELGFEQFSATLQRNKEQMLQRVACRGARFQVLVKQGRATLKVSPVL